MQLRVSGKSPVVVAHTLRVPGDVFEVPDAVGRQALREHGDSLTAEGRAEVLVENSSDVKVSELSSLLPRRTCEALAAAGISDIAALRELASQGDEAVLSIPGIGKKALAEIKAALDGGQ